MSPLLIQLASSPDDSAFAEVVRSGVEWLRLCTELTGAVVIALGIVVALGGFLQALLQRRATAFTDVRLALGRYLALALEFQLAADILSTTISPSWDRIGKLGAIAVLRTALNFFLTRELRDAGQKVTTQPPPEATHPPTP